MADAISKACKIDQEGCHQAFIGDDSKDLNEDEAAVKSSIASRQKYAAGREGQVLLYVDEIHRIIDATKKGDNDAVVIAFIEDDLRDAATNTPSVLGKVVLVMASLGWMNLHQVGSKAYETSSVYNAAKSLLSTLGEVDDQALNSLRLSFYKEAVGRFEALGAGDEAALRNLVSKVADAVGMNSSPGVTGYSTRSASGMAASGTASSPVIFGGRLVHDAAGLSGIVETIVGNAIPDHDRRGYKTAGEMTTHRAAIAAASPAEAERMNAEQAIAITRVMTDVESLVAAVAKLITVSQNHKDFSSGMGGYALVDLDPSAVAAQQGRNLADERKLIHKEYSKSLLSVLDETLLAKLKEATENKRKVVRFDIDLDKMAVLDPLIRSVFNSPSTAPRRFTSLLPLVRIQMGK